MVEVAVRSTSPRVEMRERDESFPKAMVDTSLAAFRLLELIALLFPVVALLLQLQHRVVDTEALARQGLAAGLGLLTMLSASFVLVGVYLLSIESIPLLLSISLATMSLLGLQLPVIVVLSSKTFVDTTTSAYSTTIDAFRAVRNALKFERGSDGDSEDGTETEEQN